THGEEEGEEGRERGTEGGEGSSQGGQEDPGGGEGPEEGRERSAREGGRGKRRRAACPLRGAHGRALGERCRGASVGDPAGGGRRRGGDLHACPREGTGGGADRGDLRVRGRRARRGGNDAVRGVGGLAQGDCVRGPREGRVDHAR